MSEHQHLVSLMNFKQCGNHSVQAILVCWFIRGPTQCSLYNHWTPYAALFLKSIHSVLVRKGLFAGVWVNRKHFYLLWVVKFLSEDATKSQVDWRWWELNPSPAHAKMCSSTFPMEPVGICSANGILHGTLLAISMYSVPWYCSAAIMQDVWLLRMFQSQTCCQGRKVLLLM